MDVKGKVITVVGLGNSGYNAAVLLAEHGAKVRVTDGRDSADIERYATLLGAKGVEVETGGHTEAFVKGSSLVVTSPGVDNSSIALRAARSHGVPVIGEMELGYRFCKGPIIAITGTNGKSTVTTLIGELLKGAGIDAVVCGNIGNSLCGEISRITEKTWVALEVSSFQLDTTVEFRPRIAIILNITDDHMDRYGTFESYFTSKMRVFERQTPEDHLILNYDTANLLAVGPRARSKTYYYSRLATVNGAYLKGAELCIAAGGAERIAAEIKDMRLKGLHNIENVLASILAAKLAGADVVSMRGSLSSFKGLSHRFETVVRVDGVEYIDDSKGTTVDSTARALESCDRPVILIAGGRDKNSDFSLIRELVSKKVAHLIVIGEAADTMERTFGDAVKTQRAATMEDAVKLSRRLAKSGSIVLLSPMCASFDMFRDYKHRGDVFKAAVRALEASCRN